MQTVKIHSGNVRQCSYVSSKSEIGSEAFTTLLCTLGCWKRNNGQLLDDAIVGHPSLQEPIEPSQRHSREITVKIFLLDPSATNVIQEAITQVRNTLRVDIVDVVLLAAPSLLAGHDTIPPEYLTHWKDLEACRADGKVGHIGAADVTLTQLKDIIKHSQRMPEQIQVPYNSDAISTSTIELCQFASEHGIRVGTHSDVQTIIPREQFSDALSEAVAPGAWHPMWVARYTALDNDRSVITNLGYVFAGARVNSSQNGDIIETATAADTEIIASTTSNSSQQQQQSDGVDSTIVAPTTTITTTTTTTSISGLVSPLGGVGGSVGGGGNESIITAVAVADVTTGGIDINSDCVSSCISVEGVGV